MTELLIEDKSYFYGDLVLPAFDYFIIVHLMFIAGVSDPALDDETFSWKGSFESALASDSRTRLSIEAKRLFLQIIFILRGHFFHQGSIFILIDKNVFNNFFNVFLFYECLMI